MPAHPAVLAAVPAAIPAAAPAAARPPVTVSIVSHGQLALIVPLLEQLERHSAPAIARVVLTLNILEPDLIAGRRWRFALTRIDNPRPRGFGANHNAAFAHCESDWFLVLNPDMRFDADVLAPLLAHARPDSGLLAPRIVEPGRTAPEAHRALLTPCELLARRRPGHRAPAQPDWIPGLFMLVRAAAWRAVGGFDERFFMYGEDFDLCARLRLAGWRIGIAEHLRARHEAQRASHRSARHLRWHLGSLARVWRSAAFWRYRALLRKERAQGSG